MCNRVLYYLSYITRLQVSEINAVGSFSVCCVSKAMKSHIHINQVKVGFIYTFWCSQLNSRIEALVCLQMTSSEGFQHRFTIISKFVCCGCYMKKNVSLLLYRNEMIVCQFKCHLNYLFSYQFSCL